MTAGDIGRFIRKLADPFPVVVGAATVAAGIAFGGPLVIVAGVGLWLAAAAVNAFQAGKAKETQLPWNDWARQAAGLPQDMRVIVGDLLEEGRNIELVGREVGVAEAEIRSDVTSVMNDVLRIGMQGEMIVRSVSDWNIEEIVHRANTTSNAAEAEALHEQIDVYKRLVGNYQDLLERLSTLRAQLGVVKANLLQAAVAKEPREELGGEMHQLKGTARSIAETYERLADDLPVLTGEAQAGTLQAGAGETLPQTEPRQLPGN